MFTRYKKLIISQAAAFLGVAALAFAWLRAQQAGAWGDPVASSFLFFALLLFAAEIKLLVDWTRQRHAEKTAARDAREQ